MFLAARILTTLLAAAAAIVARSAVAAEPAPTTAECIAASESGQDLRHAGKLSDARAKFALCVAASCPGPIGQDCAQRLDEVGRAMPSVVFAVKDSGGNDVPGVAIAMDGQPLAASAGTPLELDPGAHTFTFEAKGRPKVEKRLAVIEGVRREVLIVLGGAKTKSETTSPGAAKTPQAGTGARSTDEAPPWSTAPPPLAWAAFGVGGVGLAFGVIAGLVAGGKHSSLSNVCDNNGGTCPPAYADDLDSFHSWRTVSTIGYVVGGLGVAGGVTLWLTAPKAQSAKTARVWVGPASAGVGGRF